MTWIYIAYTTRSNCMHDVRLHVFDLLQETLLTCAPTFILPEIDADRLRIYIWHTVLNTAGVVLQVPSFDSFL